ncbi:succinylglutamic semialdehyde dehydrogenase [Eilatimonas milleporae]|uniref:N-succinylglutamate 5-semialdehyde dehydrogenase n=2 Tax=Eilatimonas milleporae TaxID=911205 RepID=A0A3M0CTN6_9PROT|nr:succinylglutamic semialdehyde dehydrogenase [Eilatimonas milleporae]
MAAASKGNFIAGQWSAGDGASFQSRDPAEDSLLWSGHAATDRQVDAAVRAAAAAFEDWSLVPFEDRAGVARAFAARLEADKDALARLIAQEAGKTLADATGEATAIIRKVDISIAAYEERTGRKQNDQGVLTARLVHRPHGVMAVFGPYNFPGHLPNGHIVPALIAGNSVVFKPSDLTPAVAEYMVAVWVAAGLPDGVLNMVQGGRDTGAALAGHPAIDGILFTGSAATGRAIARMLADRPEVILALEMGGNNPLIVHGAGDLDAAAVLTVLSAFVSSGQRCTCARRLIVPAGVQGDAFVKRLGEIMDGISVGAWCDEEASFMGPLVSAGAAERVLDGVGRLEKAGGRILRPVSRLSRGDAFLTPGLMDVTDVADRPDDEIFGPFLQVIRVADFEAGVREANNTRFGLAAGLISDDRALYDYFHPRIRAGIVNWNQQLTGAASTAPFGGIGWSGNHRPSAYYAADYCAYPVASMDRTDGCVRIDGIPQGLNLGLKL